MPNISSRIQAQYAADDFSSCGPSYPHIMEDGVAARPITVEKYEEMFAAYRERQSAAFVARTCGVSEGSARKYINKGDAARGLAPLKRRLAELSRRTAERADYTRAKAEAETLDAARAAKRVVVRQLEALAADPAAKIANPTRTLRDLHAVEAAILGGASEAVRVEESQCATCRDDPFAGMDDAEVMAFLEEGVAALKRYGYGKTEEEWKAESPSGRNTAPE